MNIILNKTTISTILICISATQINAQHRINEEEILNKRIMQVENNLSSWVKIENTPNWNILERMKFYNVKGVSIAVIKDFKINWAKGYGWADSAQNRMVDTKTMFQAASISKSLNALGVLKLAQERNLDLTADINTYLKSWKFPYDSVSKGKKVSLLNLLSHTGGVNVSGFDGYSKTDSLPSIIQILNGQSPSNSDAVRSIFEPGLNYKYSGGGTTISQLIIEDITGVKYSDYMIKNILTPLGMKNSFYTRPKSENKLQNISTGYYNGKEVRNKYLIYPEQAAAGLWTNPTELSKFIIEMQTSFLGESNKILTQKNTELMLTPYIDSSAALGVFIENKEGVKYFQHGGVNEGFTSLYVGSFENGNGAVVMCNSTDKTILYEIINSIAYVYNWKNYYHPILKNVVKIDKTALQKYAGNYKLNDNEYIVSQNNDNLFRIHGIQMAAIFHIPNRFFYASST